MHTPLPTRRSAVAALLSLPLALGACSSGTSPAAAGAVRSGAHLDVAAFGTLASAPGTILLDVRTPDEFATGHLQGARNIDFRAADFDDQLAKLDRNATYAVYCHSGNRSGQALQKMTSAGFTHAADLAGGITAWSQAGQAVTAS